MFPAPADKVYNLGEFIYGVVWICSGFAIGLAIVVGICFGLFKLGEWAYWAFDDHMDEVKRRRRMFDAAAIAHKLNNDSPDDVEEEWNRRNGQ